MRWGPLLFVSAAPALAEVHTFFSGFFSGTSLVAIEFDDANSSLSLVKNNTAAYSASGSKWITFNEKRDVLYVATTGYFQSYTITSDLDLVYTSNITLSSNCSNANFISASSQPPYAVFGTPYSTGCATVAITVGDDGALGEIEANATYSNSSGVHGTALSADGKFLYSADDMGNAVWVHSYDNETGAVEEVQYLAATTGSDPRHVAVHENGKWVYVVYEGTSLIASYKRDESTGKLTFTNETYSLLPSGFTNTSSYWADEVLFSIPEDGASSSSPKYLLAATRSRTTGVSGYVAAFSLDPDSGSIKEQLFLEPTTGSGGSANAVSPALFSEEYFAITDSDSSFVEVWKIEDQKNATGASVAAHLDLDEGPANVVWYN